MQYFTPSYHRLILKRIIDLVNKVNKLINEGWIPIGKILIDLKLKTAGTSEKEYLKEMVKEDVNYEKRDN